jgi:hypothetical protein
VGSGDERGVAFCSDWRGTGIDPRKARAGKRAARNRPCNSNKTKATTSPVDVSAIAQTAGAHAFRAVDAGPGAWDRTVGGRVGLHGLNSVMKGRWVNFWRVFYSVVAVFFSDLVL